MEVVLLQRVEKLGQMGDVVAVKDGYARNYLLPQKKAVLSTPENRRMLEQEKAKLEIQIAKERKIAEEMAQRLEGVVCKLQAKVSEEDRLYGSITTRDIVAALAAQNIQIEKRMVLLGEPIKTLGTFKVPIRIYTDVEPEITVEVTPE